MNTTHSSAPPLTASPMSRAYDNNEMSGALGTSVTDYGAPPTEASPLHNANNTLASRPLSSHGRSNVDEESVGNTSDGTGLDRSTLATSAGAPSRSNTLKKRGSVSRKSSLKRSSSRKSSRAGSMKGMDGARSLRGTDDEHNSIFFTPIPTSGAPTEILANRFQAWRKMLKDLITYFREIQASYEHRSKALLKVSNIMNNIAPPTGFLSDNGLAQANGLLRDYHRQSVGEANKARDIEADVINHLSILRSDLSTKIKEIRSLSGDFKNSVEKEKDSTRKVVSALEDALVHSDHDPGSATGKDDPFLIRLAVDRQIERQIDEENYLHRAYLNLEGSGRELESIVVGEIQKAYNAFAGILQREANDATTVAQALRSGPVALPKDYEWNNFVQHDEHFVNPEIPLRKVDDISYPGKFAPEAAEVRAGMLERKSKYLKSYTPGWYVLSPTHLHEFKSADRIYTQPPVMSLFLSDQKLGSRSQPGSSSHKFMLKGKQTGSMHRGHSWVFRAESYDTMLAWYDDIKTLTEKSGAERNAFVRRHARSMSAGSIASDNGSVMDEDEADNVPFSANASRSMSTSEPEHERPKRPSPGGRFPSDFQPGQYLQRPNDGRPMSPSSGSSMDDRETVSTGPPTVDGVIIDHNLPGKAPQNPILYGEKEAAQPQIVEGKESQGFQQRHQQTTPQVDGANSAGPILTTIVPYSSKANAAAGNYQQPSHLVKDTDTTNLGTNQVPVAAQSPTHRTFERHDTDYRNWMAPAVGGAAVGAGAVGAEEYWRNKRRDAEELESSQQKQREGADNGKIDLSPEEKRQMDAGNSLAADVALDDEKEMMNTDNEDPNRLDPAQSNTTSTTRDIVSPLESTSPFEDKELAEPTPLAELPAPTTAPLPSGEVPTSIPIATGPPPAKHPERLENDKSTVDAETSDSADHDADDGQTHTAYDTNPVDGKVNARATGMLFPKVLRHNTDVSVRQLHVPGEWRVADE